MPKRTKSYEVGLRERLRDPLYAMEYLRAALEDDDEGGEAVFLLALRDVAKANHMSYVAEATGLNRESLYRMLSNRGNPGINSLKAVLAAVGLRLSVEVAESAKTREAGVQEVASWNHVPEGEFIYDSLAASRERPRECGACLASLGRPPPRM